MTEQPFDVLIVGGGMVGASFACALADSGLAVGMVEAVPFAAPDQPSYDERTTALSWGTRRLFESLGLWTGLAAEAAPIRHLHVSERGRFGMTRVHHDDYGVEALGYVLPNRVLGRTLYRRLEALANVRIISPARFAGLTRDDDGVSVTIVDEHETERRLRTRLLVGADGARSRVREALGIAAETRDYHQKAIVTTVRPQRDPAGTAFERFAPDGPLAILPRSGESCAVVWTLPSGRADALLDADTGTFLAELQAAFGYRLGRLSTPGERFAYPLIRLVAVDPTAARALLVGNAGHNLHPAAAQGFNLAMRDVMVLARLLRTAARRGIDPGDADLLAEWRAARQADQRRVSEFTDRIVRIFSNRVPGLGPARSLGLLGLELLPSIKHDMARRSMGLAFADMAPDTPAAG